MANQRSVFVVVRQTFFISPLMQCAETVRSSHRLSISFARYIHRHLFCVCVCVCAKWVGYSMAKGVCSAYIVGGGGGGDNAAEKSVDRQQLPEHVPLFTQSHYAGQIYHT